MILKATFFSCGVFSWVFQRPTIPPCWGPLTWSSLDQQKSVLYQNSSFSPLNPKSPSRWPCWTGAKFFLFSLPIPASQSSHLSFTVRILSFQSFQVGTKYQLPASYTCIFKAVCKALWMKKPFWWESNFGVGGVFRLVSSWETLFTNLPSPSSNPLTFVVGNGCSLLLWRVLH